MGYAADPEFNLLDDCGSIRVEDIDLGTRLRPIDEVWAGALGAIMAREGHRTPIEVCLPPGSNRWLLVSGAHRLDGARRAGIEHLKAIIVGADDVERKMREVSENLWRKGLAPFDRATFVAELHTLLKLRAGIDPDQTAKQIAASARWQAKDAEDTMSSAYGFEVTIAEQLGLTGRTIRRDLMLHRGLPPSIMARLAGHAVANNASELRALAKLAPDTQSLAVDLLVAGEAKRVGEAVAILQQRPKPDAEAKRLSAFIGTYSRMALAEKKGAVEALVGVMSAASREWLHRLLEEVGDE